MLRIHSHAFVAKNRDIFFYKMKKNSSGEFNAHGLINEHDSFETNYFFGLIYFPETL